MPVQPILRRLNATMTDENRKAVCKSTSHGRIECVLPGYNVLRISSGMQHYPFLNSTDYWTDKYLMGGEVSRAFWNGDVHKGLQAKSDDADESAATVATTMTR